MDRLSKRLLPLITAAALCLVGLTTSGVAADDSSWLVGEWIGTANSAPGETVRHFLVTGVRPDGQVAGGFGTPRTVQPGNSTIRLTGDRVEVLTRTGNGARLVRAGDRLVGQLIIARDDKTYDVTFTKSKFPSLLPPGAAPALPGAISIGPVFRPDGPEAASYGAAQNYPVGTIGNFYQPAYLVGTHSNFDQITTVRRVPARQAITLRYAAATPAIRYGPNYARKTLQDYLNSNPVTGLLILRGDEILAEHYQYGRTDKDRFIAWSMSKSITAMLVGIAVKEGRIRSLDDTAETYAPALKGSALGATTLRHLLTMSSGVAFIETYTGKDDASNLFLDTAVQLSPGGAAAVTKYNNRIHPPGTKFHYASAETQTLGVVLTAAIGMPISTFMSERIWRPMGAEAEAYWIIDKSGQEMSFGGFNAVLRDFGRLGLLLARDGKSPDGRQLIPAEWIKAATTVRPEDRHLAPGVATGNSGSFGLGYGYQTWLLPGPRRMFRLSGVRGQTIMVDPASQIVLAQNAVRKQELDAANADTIALWYGILESLGIDASKAE